MSPCARCHGSGTEPSGAAACGEEWRAGARQVFLRALGAHGGTSDGGPALKALSVALDAAEAAFRNEFPRRDMTTTPDLAVPAEALTAVAVALHDADCPDMTCSGSALGRYRRLAEIVLDAAWPFIDAAKDERIVSLKAALRRYEYLESAGQELAARSAVSTEREKLAAAIRSLRGTPAGDMIATAIEKGQI